MANLSFQQPVSEDPSEIILIWQFGAQALLMVLNYSLELN